MARYWTNRGIKRLTVDGDLDTATLRLAGFTGTPPSQATIQDYNFLADLEAASGVAESAAAGYTRVNVGTVTISEDDANNRVNIDYPTSADLGTPATGETYTMVACFDNAGANDGARELIWVDDLATDYPTNGATATVTLGDDTVAQV